jgi:hypothetical protein
VGLVVFLLFFLARVHRCSQQAEVLGESAEDLCAAVSCNSKRRHEQFVDFV